MIDTEIVRNCLAGDRECFALLVEKYQCHVVRFCWRFLHDREEAADATQESFLQAFANLCKFDPACDFRNWLFGIAAKRCVDRIRKRRRFLKYFFYSAPIPAAAAPAQCDARIDTEALLGRLNARERLALVLTCAEGMNAREAAEIMGCAENTVRVHAFQAKRKLKKFLPGGGK